MCWRPGFAVFPIFAFLLVVSFGLSFAPWPAAAATRDAEAWATQAAASLGQCAAIDPRCAKALQLLKTGKPADAEPLLLAVAEHCAIEAITERSPASKSASGL